jgi:hypothetical protein
MDRPAQSGEPIAVRQIGAPPPEEPYRPFILGSLTLAVLVGFLLAVHVPLQRLFDAGTPGRTADLVQAHGQAQLLGFAGLFVVGMSLRIMPRIAGSRLAFGPLVPAVLWLIVIGVALRAGVLPWSSGDAHSAILVVSTLAVLVAGVCFLAIVCGTVFAAVRKADPTALAFTAGAIMLVLSGVASLYAAVNAGIDGLRTLPYLANTAIVHLELEGFLLAFILGVSVRAIPPMVGHKRPSRSARALVVGLATVVLVSAGTLLYVQYGPSSRFALRLAGAALLSLGLVLIALAWLAGVLRQAANRIRPASQPHLWLLRSAFAWMVVAALASLYYGWSAMVDGVLPDYHAVDAVRHSLGVGVVTMLIAGMSLMILPEFAGERQGPNRQRQLSLVLLALLNGAAFLRVLPALAGTSWTADQRHLSMAVAGTLGEVALIMFGGYYARLWWRGRSEGAAP